jgi:hypothetical protein
MLHDTQHRRIMNGGTTEDAYNDTPLLLEAKSALTNKSLHDFPKMPPTLLPVEMLRVNLQLATKLDYDRDVLHGYNNQNLLWFNIYLETTVTAVFNVVARGEGAIFFLDGPSGLGKTFVYSMLLASIRRDGHVAIKVNSSGITTFLLEA